MNKSGLGKRRLVFQGQRDVQEVFISLFFLYTRYSKQISRRGEGTGMT